MIEPKPLSPAAQAVLDAFWKQPGDRSALAAAFRAAVDHIDLLIERCSSPQDAEGRSAVLDGFLEIATELGGGING
jgi:hypothetical protein